MTRLSNEDINVVLREAHSRLDRKEYERALALYEQIFDGKNATIATCIGYIYHRPDSPKHNATKAKKFYQIAAEQGDTYAQHGLGTLLNREGNIEVAMKWFRKASDGGDSLSSYKLCRYLVDRKEMELADRYLNRG